MIQNLDKYALLSTNQTTWLEIIKKTKSVSKNTIKTVNLW